MIRLRGLRVQYGDTVVVPDLDLEVAEGEFFTLLGPSGCGKTTALRTLAGLVTPSAGSIHLDGRDVTRVPGDQRGVGMVFQNYALFPTMSVRENIAFGLRVRRTGQGAAGRRPDRAEADRRVRDIAERVDLAEEHLDKDLTQLSGGQQQRVAIARALVLRPKILLLDEPLSNLDAKLRGQLRVQLKELQSRFGITTVYVTHDQDEALAMSDRIAVFHQGRVEQVGTPREIYAASATETVCRFVGEASPLGPGLVGRVAERSGVALDPALSSYVRTERIGLVTDRTHEADGAAPARQPDAGRDRVEIDGVVGASSYHGTHATVDVDVLDTRLRALVLTDGTDGPPSGSPVRVRIDPDAVLQYGLDGARVLPAVPRPVAAGAP